MKWSLIWIARLKLKIKQRYCHHMFAIEDLKNVNPDGIDDRVNWPCDKCGKLFIAHCGLDITPEHGYMFRRNKS